MPVQVLPYTVEIKPATTPTLLNLIVNEEVSEQIDKSLVMMMVRKVIGDDREGWRLEVGVGSQGRLLEDMALKVGAEG